MANNTGIFFNINDNDGIPLVGVSTDGRVLINHLYGNCLIGSTTPTRTSSQPLQVTGGAYVSGNLGIGTTNPTSKLQVQGTIGLGASDDIESSFPGGRTKLTSSASGLIINHNDNSAIIFQNQGAERLRLTPAGNVGIGTTNPVGQLQVSSGPVIIGAATSTGTASQRLQVTGGAYVSSNLGIGTTNPVGQLQVSSGPVIIGAATSTGTASQRLQVTGGGYFSGKVGIGVTNPSAELVVVGNVRAGYDPSIGVVMGLSPVGIPSNDINAYVLWGDEASFGGANGDLIYVSRSSTNTSHRFYTSTSGSGQVSEKVCITSSGAVGIGTNNPGAKLDVMGDVNISGILTATKVASGIPSNNKTSAYILTKSDVGKYISISSGGVTVPAGIFSEGDVISIYNNSSNNQTITQAALVTMYFSGTSTTGNRTLSQRGLSTILCVGSNTFIIGGSGLS